MCLGQNANWQYTPVDIMTTGMIVFYNFLYLPFVKLNICVTVPNLCTLSSKVLDCSETGMKLRCVLVTDNRISSL